jgi:hypothetical protein
MEDEQKVPLTKRIERLRERGREEITDGEMPRIPYEKDLCNEYSPVTKKSWFSR